MFMLIEKIAASCNGTNEVYRFCSCAATCDNPTGVCSGPCTEGCFCRPGYVKFNGLCILPAECRMSFFFNRCILHEYFIDINKL